jgi:uncharacterized membrane protein YsdA (DUF1294 family)
MRCPKCGMECLPSERYCECGYDFQTNTVNEEKRNSPRGIKKLSPTHEAILWILAILGGLLGIILSVIVLTGNYETDSKRKAKWPLIVGCVFFILSTIIPATVR